MLMKEVISNWIEKTNLEEKNAKLNYLRYENVNKNSDTNTNTGTNILRKYNRTTFSRFSNNDSYSERKPLDFAIAFDQNPIKTFERINLDKDLVKGLYAEGFNKPSNIQEVTLNILLEDPTKNIIAQSPRGTGKTIALILAMISRVDTSYDFPQIICLVANFQLAQQMTKQITQFTQHMLRKITLKLVDCCNNSELENLTQHILIGTPEKMIDCTLSHKYFNIENIRMFVVDDGDVMIAPQGKYYLCIKIYNELTAAKCQFAFFTTTYDKDVLEFANYITPYSILIRLGRDEETCDNIRQHIIRCCDIQDKYQFLKSIIASFPNGQAIIITNTKKTAIWLANQMSLDDHSYSFVLLFGDLTIAQRHENIDRYKTGLAKVLIVTNNVLDDIDALQVSLVVNFDIQLDKYGQADYANYLQRIGRIGRFGKSGHAMNFVDSTETMKACVSIEDYIKDKMFILYTHDKINFKF